jgi:hypothetical protein
MFEKIKNLFKKPEVEAIPEPVTPKVKKPRKPKEKKVEPQLSDKEKATQAGEPYVNIIKMEIDPKDINSGSVELDFNDKFVLNLIRAGYKMKDTDTDNDIVDRWWTNLCRATVLETFEQEIADPDKRMPGDVRNVVTRDLGNGRTEVS